MGRESIPENPSVNITQIKMGSVIRGNMESKHSIRVDGHVAGNLKSDEKVIIGVHGEIGGNLSATEITIEGCVCGNVMAKNNLYLSKNAEVEGEIYTREISIEKGAQINSRITVGTEVDVPESVCQ